MKTRQLLNAITGKFDLVNEDSQSTYASDVIIRSVYEAPFHSVVDQDRFNTLVAETINDNTEAIEAAESQISAQANLSKQIVDYSASFFAAASLSAFCKTEGYNGYNLVFITINTGVPPTVQVFDIDRNYLKVATVTMPTGCTKITACMFYNGTLYIAGGTASSAGMYRMTFKADSIIVAPTFNVSELITTDGTTAIANTSVGYTMNYITIGTETRILIAYRDATPVLTYISSYNITSTSTYFDRVDATLGDASYRLRDVDKGLIYIASGINKFICTVSTFMVPTRGIWKFDISDSFEITFPSTIGNSNKLDIVGYLLGDLIQKDNYIYFIALNSSQTNNYIVRLKISDLIEKTNGQIIPLSSDAIFLNSTIGTISTGRLHLKNKNLITSTFLNGAPFSKWIHVIDLDTFKRIQTVADSGYGSSSGSGLGTFISKRSSDGVFFEELNHYVSNAYYILGFCNVFKFYSF